MNTDRFKFRIWDNERQGFTSIDPSVLCSRDNIRTLCMKDDNESRFIIEQCTGLSDENGKLIFEGDIVSGFCNKCRVCFANGSFRWSSETGVPLTQTECDFVEVIGNIHQNPEMVK